MRKRDEFYSLIRAELLARMGRGEITPDMRTLAEEYLSAGRLDPIESQLATVHEAVSSVLVLVGDEAHRYSFTLLRNIDHADGRAARLPTMGSWECAACRKKNSNGVTNCIHCAAPNQSATPGPPDA